MAPVQETFTEGSPSIASAPQVYPGIGALMNVVVDSLSAGQPVPDWLFSTRYPGQTFAEGSVAALQTLETLYGEVTGRTFTDGPSSQQLPEEERLASFKRAASLVKDAH